MSTEPQAQSLASPPLTRQIRRALLDLYDPPHLARSPLIACLQLTRQADPPAALHRVLLEAVEALKPADDIPPQANAWRTYRILLHRYIQQIPQQEIAASLGFSVRQLQRHELAALQTLADHLAPRCAAAPPDAAPTSPAAAADDELAQVRTSFANEALSLAETVQAALKVARPLLEATRTRLALEVSPELPRVAGRGIPLRQALVSILTAAAHCGQANLIELRAAAEDNQVRLIVRPVSHQTIGAARVCGDDLDNLTMARQLVALSGGALEWQDAPAAAFVVTLRLPIADRWTVLAIDDNTDSLHLLQRLLEGTRYGLIAEPDPVRAEALAGQLSPRAIILDVMLPGMDGWELLDRLREHPATAPIPIIVSTILPHEQLALTLGAAAFLRKPVSRATLLATLDALTAPSYSDGGSGIHLPPQPQHLQRLHDPRRA